MMTRMWVGIDPGQKGGVCFLSNKSKIFIYPMPELSLLPDLLNSYKIKAVFLEKAHSMPGQGVVGMFKYGHHNGFIEGILTALEIPYKLIHPKTWQNIVIETKLMKIKDPKKRALIQANKIFNKNDDFWLATKRSKKPHDGLIDSALIAEACRRS